MWVNRGGKGQLPVGGRERQFGCPPQTSRLPFASERPGTGPKRPFGESWGIGALLTFLWVPPRPVRAHLPLQGCKIARSARQASCCRFSTPRTVGSQAPQPRRPRRRSRPAPSVASLDRGRGRRGEGAGPQLQSPRPRERNPLRVTHTNVRRAGIGRRKGVPSRQGEPEGGVPPRAAFRWRQKVVRGIRPQLALPT